MPVFQFLRRYGRVEKSEIIVKILSYQKSFTDTTLAIHGDELGKFLVHKCL